MDIKTLTSSQSPVTAKVSGQVVHVERREGRGKPFWDLDIADGESKLELKVWSDNPATAKMPGIRVGDFVSVEGLFECNDFGWGAKSFTLNALGVEETEALLGGSPERKAFLDARWLTLSNIVMSMKDDDLRALTSYFLSTYEDPFRRAGAARGNHHARRGGLLEHVCEMAELASAIASVLPQLNRSLLIAGVVFHDCGKIWENQYEEKGFKMPFDKNAELFGHIAIGFGFVATLWTKCGFSPADDRLAILRHLILSHHGELAWGSPVQPACSEAFVLHHIDQISAKTEMMKGNYALPEIAPGIHDTGYPLKIHAVDVPGEKVRSASSAQ